MKEKENQTLLRQGLPRREAIIGSAIAFGGLIVGATISWAQTGEEISHSQESIHQERVFKANPKRVYEALTDTKQFDKATIGMAPGTPTQISREVGGTFSLFGGHIVGRHIELVPAQRIVQAWRVDDWAPGQYSIARFELVEQGSRTKILFDHTGFPKGQAEHLAKGWDAHYWEPLAKFLV
jgi:activator of HSP90 ATPase